MKGKVPKDQRKFVPSIIPGHKPFFLPDESYREWLAASNYLLSYRVYKSIVVWLVDKKIAGVIHLLVY